ncbi:MAG: hypothetical protein NHB36_02895 [Nitrospira sp.]|nr:hypothetical protein [Nitrospira sp.]
MRKNPCTALTASWIAILLLIPGPSSSAESLSVPWECSSYTGDVQTRCINTLSELQREKIAQLENQLRAQQNAVSQLKAQIDRQEAATEALQREVAARPAIQFAPIIYPPIPFVTLQSHTGFWLSLGHSWAFGPPYYYRPWWGPRYYRSWHWLR